MFDFIAYPLANLTILLYSWLGNSTIAAIAVLTLLINLVMLPLTLTQQRSARKVQEVQPELEKLKKKQGGKEKDDALDAEEEEEENNDGKLPF